jgi:hypothetical protein
MKMHPLLAFFIVSLIVNPCASYVEASRFDR